MLIKKFYKIFGICFILFVMSFFCNSNEVEAGYLGCNQKIENTDYYNCGDRVYTYHGPKERSSMLLAIPGYTIVYAGEMDGYSIFYANGLRYYNRTYDDRTSSNNNIWTTISREGKLIFSGEFDDSWIVDETHEGFYNEGDPLGDGIYEVIQYNNNGSVYKKLIVYNISKTISNIYNTRILSFEYDGKAIEEENAVDVIELQNKLAIKIGTNFGIKKVSIKVNDIETKDYSISKNTIIFGPNFNNIVSRGNTNKIKIIVENYLGFSVTKTYYINALSSNVSINFASISSEVISSSRRIVINADAGIGGKLDRDYCWYYWSTNPNDSLKYEDFLINYARSEYKGSYSEDKGVILRNTAGTYYLYALAKDEDSYIVSRSEGYTLDDTGFYVSYSEYDAILVVSLLIIAIIPISIYLFIRKRGY